MHNTPKVSLRGFQSVIHFLSSDFSNSLCVSAVQRKTHPARATLWTQIQGERVKVGLFLFTAVSQCFVVGVGCCGYSILVLAAYVLGNTN